MRTGFFAYPWDMLDEGPEQAVDAMATRLGCNAIALNCNYHHARLLRPRATAGKVLELPGAVAAFEPRPERYTPGGLMPVPEPRLAKASVVARTRAACAARGVDFGLWIVGLHNSTLGETHPELCMHNCFGDVYTYALCPSQTAVQAYAQSLVDDVCLQFEPDRVILEAAGYLGLRHNVHHELFFADWSESLDLLLSLCFCPACSGRSGMLRPQVERLAARVAAVAERLLEEERDHALEGSASEAASLLMEIPDLATYVQACAARVTDLVSHVRAVANSHGVACEVIPSSFHRPVSRSWMEHAPLSALGECSDGLVVPTYFDNAAQVTADLSWAAMLAPNGKLIAGLNACAPAIRNQAVLAAQALAAKDAGCAALYVYNYGLLTHRRLEWAGNALRAVQGGGG